MFKRSKKRIIEKFIQGWVLVLLVILTVSMMFNVNSIQGNARVINYAGIIRGATQRVIKLEIAGQSNDDLIVYLDDIFDGLMHGGGKYDLTILPDKSYQNKLKHLYTSWNNIKKEINENRSTHYANSHIISMSEDYFQQADQTVSAAEDYSQRCATKLRKIEDGLIIVITIMIAILIKESISPFILVKNNSKLNKKAYLDLATGLPNRSSIEELIRQYQYYYKGCFAIVIFDLNDLKETNDSLGHISGDKLISSFAHIIRKVIPKKHFVGRYGGDEFIAILENVNSQDLKKMIKNIQEEVAKQNKKDSTVYIDFACGYALSNQYPQEDIRYILSRADKNMYITKEKMKEERKEKM
ncbi:GGDEF domain-containing protein [Erysipelatoclostridium sp. AM42-17]|uniref:GGDEF domain-containing protein n=1 Tax=Erysipelatoclostridium sp. AM42-17 TaxID=2293102 RepID=UPI000E4A1443|nr:GGDEF domain-containing protein [Erysipelatoclostridium sp. AM42-17]RHS95677.1 GGDEF domain-containing protein [Erysipelatoclostridium sp. AM42-17]